MRIINASKRTDLPTFYADWLADCMAKAPEDFFVLWTKDIRPLVKTGVLDKHHNWYVQHTITGYFSDLENIKDKKGILSELQSIANLYGKQRIVVRYDPILLWERYTMEYHKTAMKQLIAKCQGITDTIVFSFLDIYGRTPKHFGVPTQLQQQELAQSFSESAKDSGIKLSTCAEAIDLSRFGIDKSQCVDPKRIEMISETKILNHLSAQQRKECGCVKAEDIGSYQHKCLHSCKYCYANHR